MLIFNKPVLTTEQFERLSNIFDNAGQIVFGAGVFTPVLSGIDKVNIYILLSCIVGVLFCWFLSVWLAKRGKEQIWHLT